MKGLAKCCTKQVLFSNTCIRGFEAKLLCVCVLALISVWSCDMASLYPMVLLFQEATCTPSSTPQFEWEWLPQWIWLLQSWKGKLWSSISQLLWQSPFLWSSSSSPDQQLLQQWSKWWLLQLCCLQWWPQNSVRQPVPASDGAHIFLTTSTSDSVMTHAFIWKPHRDPTSYLTPKPRWSCYCCDSNPFWLQSSVLGHWSILDPVVWCFVLNVVQHA